MKSVLSLIALLLFSTLAFADGEHTEDVCSTKNIQICAHLGHMENLEPGKAGSFVAHITGPAETFNMSIVLWMPSMGHGTAPVSVGQFAVNKYFVTNAQFIMKGQWSVQLRFVADGDSHLIEIPLEIK